MADAEDWQRVAEKVRARREALDLTQEEAAERGGKGVSSANWRLIEAGKAPSSGQRRSGTRRGVSLALRWTADSVDRILRGEEPIEVPAEVPEGATYSAPDPNAFRSSGQILEEVQRLTGELIRREREGRL